MPNLSDERAPYKTPDMFPGFLLAFLPGILYQTQEVERIEQAPDTQLQFHPMEDIARALVDELRNRGLFKAVVYSQNDTEGELILRGRLTSTYINRTLYQYGITAVGAVYLSILGPPLDKMHMTLALALQLEEPQTQTTLWQKDYKKEREFYRNLWYGPKDGDIQYDSMLKELMPQILADIEEAIKSMTTAAAEASHGP